MGRDYIRKTIDFFKVTLNVLKKLKEEEVSVEEVANHPDMPEFFEEKHRQWELILSNWYANVEKYV